MFLVNVLILFNVEKFLSDSADVMGVVMLLLSRVQVSDLVQAVYLVLFDCLFSRRHVMFSVQCSHLLGGGQEFT